MDYSLAVSTLRKGERLKFPKEANTEQFAQVLDKADPISHLRSEFVLPTKASLKKQGLNGQYPGTLSCLLAP
jgi:kynureninase